MILILVFIAINKPKKYKEQSKQKSAQFSGFGVYYKKFTNIYKNKNDSDSGIHYQK